MTGASAKPTALVGPEGLEPHSRLHASHDIASAEIHTARKAGPCANAAAAKRGVEWAQHCNRMIAAGDQYVEGDLNLDKAGGFGRDRYCMACAERGLA